MAKKGIGASPWSKPKVVEPKGVPDSPVLSELDTDTTTFEDYAVPFDGVSAGFNVWIDGHVEATASEAGRLAVRKLEALVRKLQSMNTFMNTIFQMHGIYTEKPEELPQCKIMRIGDLYIRMLSTAPDRQAYDAVAYALRAIEHLGPKLVVEVNAAKISPYVK